MCVFILQRISCVFVCGQSCVNVVLMNCGFYKLSLIGGRADDGGNVKWIKWKSLW